MSWLRTWARRTLLPWTPGKTIVAASGGRGDRSRRGSRPGADTRQPGSRCAQGHGQAHAYRPARRGQATPAAVPVHRRAGEILGRVLAVKIDNIVYARPQTGLTDADIVYVLPVEGGLTRFLAIFSSHFPPVIGPVRSARRDDLQLLGQFGRPAFAFSGAQGQLLPVVEHARIVDLYAGRGGGYYRDYQRIAPYNLFATTRVLLAQSRARQQGAQHRLQIRPGASRRPRHQVETGDLPVRAVHLHLVGEQAPLAGHRWMACQRRPPGAAGSRPSRW